MKTPKAFWKWHTKENSIHTSEDLETFEVTTTINQLYREGRQTASSWHRDREHNRYKDTREVLKATSIRISLLKVRQRRENETNNLQPWLYFENAKRKEIQYRQIWAVFRQSEETSYTKTELMFYVSARWEISRGRNLNTYEPMVLQTVTFQLTWAMELK